MVNKLLKNVNRKNWYVLLKVYLLNVIYLDWKKKFLLSLKIYLDFIIK